MKDMKNKDFKILLVPTDFSENATAALTAAIQIAKRANAKIVLIHVVEISGFAVPSEMISLNLVSEEMMDIAKENLKSLAATVRKEHGITVDYYRCSGYVYDNIIRTAHLYQADLIIMGTQGASGIKEWIVGSNAYSVVKNSTIPVLTIPNGPEAKTFNKVIFPFNDKLFTLSKFDQVAAFCHLMDSSVMLMGFTEEAQEAAALAVRKKGEELSIQFNEQSIFCTFSLVKGSNYGDEILRFAEKNGGDVIAIVSGADHSFESIFRSSTEKKLVHHSYIPVLSTPLI